MSGFTGSVHWCSLFALLSAVAVLILVVILVLAAVLVIVLVIILVLILVLVIHGSSSKFFSCGMPQK